MRDYDEMRRGLAEAMGFTILPDGVVYGRAGRRALPDPLGNANDAEALEMWMVDRFDFYVSANRDFYAVRLAGVMAFPVGPNVWTTDEPDPARRRRRALVEAAWQAVQRARS